MILPFFALLIIAPLLSLFFVTFWVYRDAKRYQANGVDILSPSKWAVLVFFILPLFFPIYLVLKYSKYSPQAKSLASNPSATPSPLQGQKKLVVIALISVIVLVYVYIALAKGLSKVALRTEFANQVNEQLSNQLQSEIEQQQRSKALRPPEIDVVFNYIVKKYIWSPYGYNVNSKCVYVDSYGSRKYANLEDPDCWAVPHISGATPLDRWNELRQELLQRGSITSQDPFPEQNARGLNMDYVFITDGNIASDQSAYFMYWTDPQTAARWQMDSKGIVTTAR